MVFGGIFLTSFGLIGEKSAYGERLLGGVWGAMPIGAYLASETRLYGSQGPLTLIARAVENTSLSSLRVELY